jgi:hypothetical protein
MSNDCHFDADWHRTVYLVVVCVTYIYIYICMYSCVCVLHTYVHTYIHTYTHTRTNVWVFALSCSSFISFGVMCCVLSLVFWSCFRLCLIFFAMLRALCETCAAILRTTIADSSNILFYYRNWIKPRIFQSMRQYRKLLHRDFQRYLLNFLST